MLTARKRRKLIEIGVFVLPIVLVKGTGVLLGGGGNPLGLGSAIGASGVAPAVVPVTTAPRWTEAQRSAAEYAAGLTREAFAGTPMYYDPRTTNRDEPSHATPGADVVVTGIMDTSAGALALINGRMYRVGDVVTSTTWTITSVDSDARSVGLTDMETGEAIVRSVPLPR